MLADDSGIEVDALGGRPGVLSARFAGEGLDDAGRKRAMLDALRDVPSARRTARYRAVIALVDPDVREAVTEGVVEGVILNEPRGSGGFGYDPLLFYPPLNATFAEVLCLRLQRPRMKRAFSRVAPPSIKHGGTRGPRCAKKAR